MNDCHPAYEAGGITNYPTPLWCKRRRTMKVGALLHEVGKRRILTQTEDKVLHVRSATFISFIVIEVFIDVAILQYCN